MLEDIVDDVDQVGNNCISWYARTETGILLRIKVYNKLVQMLESVDIRKSIGSRLHDLVSNSSDEFQQILLNASEYGLTRVEIKVHSQDVYDLQSYINLMNDTLDFIYGCRVYKQSFENHWRLLVDQVFDKPVVMVYDRINKIFGYSHWYNSLTHRMPD